MAENKAPKSGREFSGNRQRRMRRKVCQFCANKTTSIDCMDAETLKKYISESGKILPRRMTGTCAAHQREVTTAIKRARHLAVLPFSVR